MMEIEKPRMNVEENSDGTYIKIVVEPLFIRFRHAVEGQFIHGRRNMGGNGFRLPVFLPAAVGYEVLPLPLLQLLQQVFIHFL